MHHQTPLQIVDVLLPLAFDQAYSYAVPQGLALELGDVVSLPFGKSSSLGSREAIGVVWAFNTQTQPIKGLKFILSKLDWPVLSSNMRGLIDWIANYTLAPRGLVLKMALRDPAKITQERPSIGVRFTGVLPKRSTPQRMKVQEIISSNQDQSKVDLAKNAGVSTSVINGLIDEGVLETYIIEGLNGADRLSGDFAPPDLSDDQNNAAQILQSSTLAQTPIITLLEGVTGSGKTEVYFEAIASALNLQKQILILMPEIALTAQFLERFAKRFGGHPCEWHSGISEAKRGRHYHAIAQGKIRVVAGARSALFLPFTQLGLIIVDEEHEAAYKQGDGVQYHARDMAIMRGKFENCPVILASATPSIETKVNVGRGRYAHVKLQSRYGGQVLPHLTAIDMRKAGPKPGTWIAPPLEQAIHETIKRGEQTILFLNRRGFAPLTLCRGCGHRWQCPNCTAWLVEHRTRGSLICHHCGHAERIPRKCSACHAEGSLSPVGPGVERLGEEVCLKFPEARSVVFSSDFAGGSEKLRAELAKVAAGAFDIIIGTQLIAKGHNFLNVTLAAVIDSDIGLANGDPRAAERTFQLLHQVTGRAGRGALKGNGVLQSYQPEHPVLRALLSGQSERFYTQEIEARLQAGLPPFGRLAGIIVSALTADEAENHAQLLARAAFEQLKREPAYDAIVVLGPTEAPIAMIRGRYRFRLLMKAPRKADLQGFIRGVIARAGTVKGSVKVYIDIDPLNFM